MAHPMSEHRQHKVEKSRVASITQGCASGGSVHSDAAQDKALIRKTINADIRSGKIEGKACGGRLDRPKRASGGRVQSFAKGGKVKGTTVNVIVAPSGQDKDAVPVPIPVGAGAPAPKPPMMPPPLPPPGVGASGGPGVPPGPPPIRANGGRAYASGGGVKSGPAWKEGLRNATPIQHTDGKNDQKNIHRGRQITYATGGKVEAGTSMGPKMTAGAGSERGRMEKIAKYGGK